MPAAADLLDPELAARLPPSTAAALLTHILRHQSPPRNRRIFVNRTLRMETVRFVGFDLDWTLADYERLPLEELTFRLAIERLIAHHGYPDVLRQAEFRPDFPRRGLLIDKEAGTVLRMSRHRYVGGAYLGRRALERAELSGLYRREPLNPASERFYRLDTLFELSEANLFAEAVELALGGHLGDPPPAYGRLFDDVRRATDWVHAEGDLKPTLLADPSRFLRRDPEIALALFRLALGGRRLVLLTNSGWSYAEGICSYLFDGVLPGLDSWRQLFDLAVVDAGKPGFFRFSRPFVRLDTEGPEVECPGWGGVYQGGCLPGLSRLLDAPGERVLYVGDHIYGDVVTTKRGSTWRTALIVRELEEELDIQGRLGAELAELARLKGRIAGLGHRMDHLQDVLTLYRRLREEEGATVPTVALERVRQLFEELTGQHREARLRATALSEEMASRFNPTWGSLFQQGSSKTLFASQLEAYACLYTSRVSNFAFYGTDHYFRVIEDPMRHDWEKAGSE